MTDAAMDDDELATYLAERITSAMNADGGDLSAMRQSNLNYYLGEPYGNEREGYSTYRSREVMETVEWALPSLLRVFTSGDNVAMFDPVGPEDEAQAEQETEAVNEALRKQDDYFLQVHHWFKSCLMEPVSYLRLSMDNREEVKGEEYQGLTVPELVQLLSDPAVEVTAQDEYVATTPMGPHPVLDVKIKRTIKTSKLKCEALPGDEVLILDNDHTSLNLDDTSVVHRSKKTYSWLLENGFDRDKLDEISPDAGEDWDTERTNRLFTSDESWDDEQTDKSLRTYWVHDASVLVDYDGDGIAERRRVVMVGDKVFINDEYDYQGIVALSSVPMPHRHPGLSLAELVKDLQLLKSTLMRQLLDNVYRQNRPRTYVGINALTDDGKTMSALLNPLSEYIPVEDHSQIRAEVQTSFVNEILPVIQFTTDAQQTRTGIAPNLSLDPKVIQQSTMGAFSGALEQASQRIEMIARVIAETGFKWLVRKAHRLLKEHSQMPMMLRRRGQWVEVNPADWRERDNVTVNVGLGFNDKSKDLSVLQQILALQVQAMPMGLAKPANIYNTLDDLVAASGRKNPERYFTQPNPNPPPPQPDPLVVAQVENLKMQGQAMMTDAQSKVMRAQVEAQKAQLEREKAQFEANMTEREAELTAQIKQFEAQTAAGKVQAEVRHTDADTALKAAQRVKVLEEARALDIESDAAETQVVDFLKGINDAEAEVSEPA